METAGTPSDTPVGKPEGGCDECDGDRVVTTLGGVKRLVFGLAPSCVGVRPNTACPASKVPETSYTGCARSGRRWGDGRVVAGGAL